LQDSPYQTKGVIILPRKTHKANVDRDLAKFVEKEVLKETDKILKSHNPLQQARLTGIRIGRRTRGKPPARFQ